ncbi:TPA: hypothetical protein N0F65_006059 [Lagenidium giganteum]|uniref:Uncharacterized protein n=1 Tax=Lagenidium giganteum TaxID=4803 RepID=A0AAV2YLU1_9STRA|nr:TPA: hypothetical protein N0F65_006059 [Lagenidium giganteum]
MRVFNVSFLVPFQQLTGAKCAQINDRHLFSGLVVPETPTPPIHPAPHSSALSPPQPALPTNAPWVLRFDGACRANPGPVCAGAALTDPTGKTIWTTSFTSTANTPTTRPSAMHFLLVSKAPSTAGLYSYLWRATATLLSHKSPAQWRAPTPASKASAAASMPSSASSTHQFSLTSIASPIARPTNWQIMPTAPF